MKLLYATGNRAKLDAMRSRASGLDLEILGLADMDRKAPPVPEDGRTPLENARQKALAYYDFYKVPLFSCDSGLYFENVPEEQQPGIHVRTVGGKYLTDDEMLAYYSGLAKKYGDLKAGYRNAVCLILDRDRVYESMDASLASRPFLITSRPHSKVRQKGFPLDSLSVDIQTGKYYYDMEKGQTEQLAVEDSMLKFFKDLGL